MAPGQPYKSCFLVAYGKLDAMRLTAKLWLEPPEPKEHEFPRFPLHVPELLAISARGCWTTNLQLLPVISAFETLCLHFRRDFPPACQLGGGGGRWKARSFAPTPSPRIPPGGHAWAGSSRVPRGSHPSLLFCSALPPLFFLLPRCVSTSVGRGDVPARLITVCLPEFPGVIPPG